ncbi:MAG: allulose-6-phosphate 3-epimerase [Clostridia bacterium]|nr:allulose-6-phosphate 3-epimerase [Clostridia bacterium]
MAFLLSDSSMCLDLLHVADQMKVLDREMDYHHADVMDGHYCPIITLSPDLGKALCSVSEKPVEVHLMVEKPAQWLEIFAKAGASMLTMHAETINTNAFRLIRQVRSLGCKVGIAINPATPFEYVSQYIDEIDRLVLMAVDVGYSGQAMVPQVVKKIRQAADYKKAHGLSYEIMVDGCCNNQTYELYGRAGAEVLVMGSGLFGLDPDISKAIEIMRAQQAQACKKLAQAE